MTKHRGGDRVDKGSYWDLRHGTRVDVAENGILPGGRNIPYWRLSPAVMLLVAPICGLLYVIALPFVVIGTLLFLRARKITIAAVDLLGSFGWRPVHAYLAGRMKGKTRAAKQEAKEGNENNKPL